MKKEYLSIIINYARLANITKTTNEATFTINLQSPANLQQFKLCDNTTRELLRESP